MEVEKTSAELEAEIQVAEEAAKKLSEDTTDGGEGGDKPAPGVAKKDYLQMSVEEIPLTAKRINSQTTPFSPRNRAIGVINLFWLKLGHGMGAEETMALQDTVMIALEDAYDAGRKDGEEYART